MKHMTACFVGLSFAMAGISAHAQTVAFDGPNGWDPACQFIEFPGDCNIAASSSNLLVTINTRLKLFTKAGAVALADRQLLIGGGFTPGFFRYTPPFDTLPLNYVTDPKCLYDQYSGRFVVICIVGTILPRRLWWIGLAVSTNGNPQDWNSYDLNTGLGSWRKFTIDGTALETYPDHYEIDFPGLGVDSNAVYITLNTFKTGASGVPHSRIFAIKKPDLWNNHSGDAQLAVSPPGTAGAEVTVWGNDHQTGGVYDQILRNGDASATESRVLQPAHHFGATSRGYIVNLTTEGFGGTGPAYSNKNTNGFAIYWPGGGAAPQLEPGYTGRTACTDPGAGCNTDFSAAAITNAYPLEPNICAVPGSCNDAIEANSTRALNAVWRNGKLYYAYSMRVPPSQPPVAPYFNTHDVTDCYYNIASTTAWPASISVLRREKLPRESGANANVAQHFPAVMANQAGTVAVSFTRNWQDSATVSVGEHPSMYFTYRLGSDPAIRPPTKLRGYLTSDPNDFCGKPEASSGHKQYWKGRWGDFSGIALDPDDDCTLWLFNMYARMPVDPVTCADCTEEEAWWGTWVQKWSGGCDFADRPGGGGSGEGGRP